MKKNKKRIALKVLQETARQLTFEGLKKFVIPQEIRNKLVLGTLFDGDTRIFELYIPGERPSDAVVISRVRVNSLSGEIEGAVEIFTLHSK